MLELNALLDDHGMDKDVEYKEWIEAAGNDLHHLQEVAKFAFGAKKEQHRGRASWILHHVGDNNPEALLPLVEQMVRHLPHCITDAEERIILRYFSKHHIPEDEELRGLLLDFAFETFNNPKKAVAQRVYGMTVAYVMTKEYPEIALELAASIQTHMEYGSAGLKNRGGKILASLSKQGLI